jgi:hypothetical protein
MTMSPLFALGEQRLMPPPAWLVKINAVMKGTLDAQTELDCAQGEDNKRLAEQKLTRFIFTAERLLAERERAQAIARLLAA